MAQICQVWLPPVFKYFENNSLIGLDLTITDFAPAVRLVKSLDFVKFFNELRIIMVVIWIYANM